MEPTSHSETRQGKIRLAKAMEETTAADTSMLMPPPAAAAAVAQKKKMKVMVAVDESETSFYALEWALGHLFNDSGASSSSTTEVESGGMVTVVHVTEPFQHYVAPAGPAVYATSVVESVRKAQEENAAAVLSRTLQMCKEKMIEAETIVLQGDPKDMICEATEQMHVDLLVVGSRGLSKIKRAFLGSVSDYCAHQAKCPILIVKPPKESHK